MSLAAQCDTLNSTKPNATNSLITEDPSLIFSIVKVALTNVCQGLSSLAPGGGKMRDPGKEVDHKIVMCFFSGYSKPTNS